MSTMDSFNLLSSVWSHLTNIQVVRGEGIYLYDAEGNQYIDFTSGIGVTNTGHAHPKVVKAIQEQAANLIFAQMNVAIPKPVLELVETLNEVTPRTINQFFLANGGAEAVEASVKLARQATGRRNIIVFQGSFHGRTYLTMGMSTAKYLYRYNYQPLPAGIFVAPFPASYQYGWDYATTTEFCLKQLKLLFQSQSAPAETAAIIVEPVLGEGGYIPAPLGFLEELRHICYQHDILFVLDEIQTGFGRTGKLFCYEHAEVIPDILVMAKGMGSGLPISGIGANRELMSAWRNGTHGGTYGGGSAVVAAGAKAGIEVILEEELSKNAAVTGHYLLEQLHQLQEKYPSLGDIRGRGLMVATEFSRAGEPDAETATKVLQGCLNRNLLMLKCGTHENIIRWIPPLVVTTAQIDEALGIFEAALKEAV